MAIKEVWIGSSGPMLYDDTEQYPGEPAEDMHAFRSDGRVVYAPGEEPDEGVNVGQLTSHFYTSKAIAWFMS